jgi:hypothetical protein
VFRSLNLGPALLVAFDVPSASTGTTVATVFPEIVRQALQCLNVGSVIVIRAFAARSDQPGGHQTAEMVAEGGCGDVEPHLNVTRAYTGRSPLYQDPEDRETHGVSERMKLIGMPLDIRGHALVLEFY